MRALSKNPGYLAYWSAISKPKPSFLYDDLTCCTVHPVP